ncbi:phage holin family protein [Paenibacillus endoradicis]|uniref:phage holin family protein n=1 Tax=Paenibacillus endoradicis TaxID=2972487 RepID=UPI002158D176|nr:phage holin family protein [Paenibacillus endoradicis]MCR8655849.1 phage holin family protein [Paenibacillus endoradicis]MCR8658175.1 phage holin family protein [Paenibacillus endoradicis]
MEFIFDNEIYVLLKQYIQPEMLIVVPTLLFLGWMMKSTPKVPDWLIPYVNTVVGIIAGIAMTPSVIDGIIQGILVSAMSILVYNLYRQWKRKNGTDANNEKEQPK